MDYGGVHAIAQKTVRGLQPQQSAADYNGVLGAIARGIDAPGAGVRDSMEKTWAKHGHLLGCKR